MTQDEMFRAIGENKSPTGSKIRLKDGRVAVGRVYFDSQNNEYIASEMILVDERFKADDVVSIEKYDREELVGKIQEL